MLFDARSEPPAAPATAPGPVLDPRRLEVYAVALEFQLLASRAVPRGHGALKDQLERASVSIVLNIAEGSGHRAPGLKAHFYNIARGSATECSAVFDLLHLRRIAPESLCGEAHAKLVRIVQMLTRLEASVLARSARG